MQRHCRICRFDFKLIFNSQRTSSSHLQKSDCTGEDKGNKCRWRGIGSFSRVSKYRCNGRMTQKLNDSFPVFTFAQDPPLKTHPVDATCASWRLFTVERCWFTAMAPSWRRHGRGRGGVFMMRYQDASLDWARSPVRWFRELSLRSTQHVNSGSYADSL